MISPLVLKTIKDRNEKTTEKKLERNVKKYDNICTCRHKGHKQC